MLECLNSLTKSLQQFSVVHMYYLVVGTYMKILLLSICYIFVLTVTLFWDSKDW